jgi:hypothetical protein
MAYRFLEAARAVLGDHPAVAAVKDALDGVKAVVEGWGSVGEARQAIDRAKEAVTAAPRYARVLLRLALLYAERALAMLQDQLVLRGVVAWVVDRDTVVVAGYISARWCVFQRISILPWPPWPLLPFMKPLAALKAYLVELPNGSAVLAVNQHVVVYGKLVGVDEATGLVVVEAIEVRPVYATPPWLYNVTGVPAR